MEKTEIRYKTNFFSPENTIVFTDKDLSLYSENELIIHIDKNEISNIRYGVSWISGIYFTIGRLYCIDIGNNGRKTIKIRLRSLYGVYKNLLGNKYNEFIDKLYEFYFDEKIQNYITSINEGSEVEIAGVIFKREGICLDLKKQDGFIEWEDLNSRAYSYYYTLSSKRRPEFYKAFTYLTDWNAVLVYSVSRQILMKKGLFNEQLTQ